MKTLIGFISKFSPFYSGIKLVLDYSFSGEGDLRKGFGNISNEALALMN